MKKLLTFLGILIISLLSFKAEAQLVINQSYSPSTNLKVGDTITVSYNVSGVSKARYVWLRYQYNAAAMSMVSNSTTFGQGSSTQTYFYEWTNYVFNPNTNSATTDLYGQYGHTPWNYVSTTGNNVGQLTVQRTDKSISGTLATQKFVLKDVASYANVHKLDLAYALDSAAGTTISSVTTTQSTLSLGTVTGATSSFTIKVLYPSTYTNINQHNVQLMHIKADGSIDWSQQPIKVGSLDASGMVTFTSGIKVGDSVGVFITPAYQKTFMDNIVTVADAYKAFLGISQVDITGAQTYWTYPKLEKMIGMVGKGDTTFTEKDPYYLFAYVMGQDMSSVANIPTSTATNIAWHSGLLNQSWLDGTPTYRVYVTDPNQTVNAVYAWGGDMAFNESPSPAQIGVSINNGVYTNSEKAIPTPSATIKSFSIASNSTLAYTPAPLDTANLNINSSIVNGKVILTADLTKQNLAGLQVIMNYDSTKVSLDNVTFDAGSDITNFSTHNNGRLTFGSIDQIKTARIKTGTPYTLTFTPKVPLQNTAGLFFFVLADAVDAGGKKINLIVQ